MPLLAPGDYYNFAVIFDISIFYFSLLRIFFFFTAGCAPLHHRSGDFGDSSTNGGEPVLVPGSRHDNPL